MIYSPHQVRVVEEQLALQDKLVKLEAFFATDLYSQLDLAEQCRLHRQSIAMGVYLEILEERIANFK